MYKNIFLRHIITLLALTCLSINAFADEIKLQKNHPYRHVVIKGDTLWGISGKFLENPWLWPQIWKMNRAEIKNPHLIYPGDVVVLDTSGKNPQLRLLRETITLEPGVRIEPLERDAVQTISPSVITPFLTRPLLIEKNQLKDAPRIIATQDNRVILSPGTRVYVNSIKEEQGTHWSIYRAGEKLIDPDTKETLGTEANYLGDLNITRFGEPASADIIIAKEEMFVKDRLVAASDGIQSNFIPHAPSFEVKGRIMRIHGGVGGSVAEAGPNTVVSINLGKKNGMEEGHVLAIARYGQIIKDPEYKPTGETPKSKPKLKELNFDITRDENGMAIVNFAKKSADKEVVLQPGQVKLPDERVGILMIFRTFDRVSYGLIMSVSDAVYTLDAVHTP